MQDNSKEDISGPSFLWGGRVVRWCWVNFQCRGVLLVWIKVGQGPTALVVGAGGGGLDIFSLIYHFSLLSPSLWETARYRLQYCLKEPLYPKQPTNQPSFLLILTQTSSTLSRFLALLHGERSGTYSNIARVNLYMYMVCDHSTICKLLNRKS